MSTSFSLIISELAENQIVEIEEYISLYMLQPNNAFLVLSEIYDKFEKIKQNPYLFEACKWLPNENNIYRNCVCLSWKIIYKIDDDTIKVLAIIHSSRHPREIISLK